MMISPLPHRGIIEIQGEDKSTFLQGLISNDIHKVTPHQSIYATLLTPRGRFLYDFFIKEKDETYLLESEKSRLPDLLKRLNLYKLRSRVTLRFRPELEVFAVWGAKAVEALHLIGEPGYTHSNYFIDPRLAELGARGIGLPPEGNFQHVTPQEYNVHRLKLGIPEGGIDLIPEKSILLESGLDELHAISWNKGCYIGQELTTRTKFQGLVRKRLFPVEIEGPPPSFGDEIFLNGLNIGFMRSHANGYGLALLRLEYIKNEHQTFRCAEATLRAYKPFWMKLENMIKHRS